MESLPSADKAGAALYRHYLRRKRLAVAVTGGGGGCRVPALAYGRIVGSQFGGAAAGYGGARDAPDQRRRVERARTALVCRRGRGRVACALRLRDAECFAHPLASASTLGVSQGASFGAAVAIVCFGGGTQINAGGASAALSITNPALVTTCAFLGGIATTAVILLLSRLRGASPSAMVLAGVALSSMFTGGVDAGAVLRG